MQQLHLVGFTTDHRALIFSVRRGAKSGSYTVAVDDALFAVIEDAKVWLAEAGGEEPMAPAPVDNRPQSQLSVREMQARLRRGMSVDDVAADAGVEPSWVARFAAPVLTERAEIIRAVRATRFERRTGPSGAPLGEAVYRNLAERGVLTPRDELDRAWSARQVADGLWEVSFRYTYRQRPHSVRWSYDASAGKVVARDRLASSLAFRPGGTKASARSRNGRASSSGRVPLATREQSEDEPPLKPPKAVKQVAAARKAAVARMAAEVQKTARRDQAIARAAAKRPPRPIPPRIEPESEPEPEVVADEPITDDSKAASSADASSGREATNGRRAAVVVRGEGDEADELSTDDADAEEWEPAEATDRADVGDDTDDDDAVDHDAVDDGDEDDDEADEAAADADDGWADEDWVEPEWDEDDSPVEPVSAPDRRPLLVIDPERPRRRAPLRARPAEEPAMPTARRVVGERPTIRAAQAGSEEPSGGEPAGAPRRGRRQLRAR